MTVWNLRGTEPQNNLVREALAACDFPFDELLPSLQREGKTSIAVDWADLSRYVHGAEGHEHAEGAHTIVREVDGRERVLGLFYLPPHTGVILDVSLEARPPLCHEVSLSEFGHGVDYHYVEPHGLRPAVWNALHAGPADDVEHVSESGDLDHGHSWFDGPAGYASWVGEAFMEAFIRAFAPSIPVTIQLAHPVSAEAAATIRAALLAPLAPPAPEPTPEPDPTPPPAGRVYRGKRKHVVHDSHVGVEAVQWFDSLAAAQAAGLRACKVCRPT